MAGDAPVTDPLVMGTGDRFIIGKHSIETILNDQATWVLAKPSLTVSHYPVQESARSPAKSKSVHRAKSPGLIC